MEPTLKEACRIMKRVHDEDIARGMKINVKSATILFIASKLTGANKELGDIMSVTSTTQKDIAKCYKKLKTVLPNAVMNQTSSKYAEDAATKLKLPENVVALCKNTAENISKLEILTGKKPATIAGVAIWMIVRRSPALKASIPSPAVIADMLGMSEPAIKSAFKEVECVEDDVLPVGFKR